MKPLAWFVILAPIALLLVVILGIAVWLLVAVKSSDAPSTQSANRPQSPPLADEATTKQDSEEPPAAVFTDEDLAKAFKADAKAVLAKYAGKQLAINGTVWMAESDNPGFAPKIVLRGFWCKAEFAPEVEIHCWMPPREEARVDRLAKGQRVKIQGVLEDDAFTLKLTQCELIEVGPSPALRVGVKELAHSFREGSEKAKQQYENKPLRVTGKVVLVEAEAKTRVYYLLTDPTETNNPPEYLLATCPCMFNEKLRDRLAAVAVGQQIEVFGKVGSDLAIGACLDEGKILTVTGDKDTKPSSREQTPPIAVKDTELSEALLKDPLATWFKYANKRLEVRGVVEEAACSSSEDLPFVTLRGYQSHTEITWEWKSVWCRFPASMQERIEALAKGQHVAIRGLFRKTGQSFDLSNCDLIDAGASPAVRATVPDLVQAFQRDRKATQAKYDGKAVFVEGRVTQIDISDNSPIVDYFLADPGDKSEAPACLKVSVSCANSFGKLRKRLKAVKIGQTVKVLGEVSAPPDEAEIRVKNGKLLR